MPRKPKNPMQFFKKYEDQFDDRPLTAWEKEQIAQALRFLEKHDEFLTESFVDSKDEEEWWSIRQDLPELRKRVTSVRLGEILTDLEVFMYENFLENVTKNQLGAVFHKILNNWED